MRKSIFMLGALVAAGCNNPAQVVIAGGIPVPDEKDCSVDSGAKNFFGSLVLDVGFNLGLEIPVVLENHLNSRSIGVVPEKNVSNTVVANTITPTRFVSQWECDTNNSANYVVGPLFLPRFSVTSPYCLDKRSELRDSQGFDVLSASGAPISPELGKNVVWLQAVPVPLGRDMEELFRLSVLADQCSRELSQMGGVVHCNELEKFFKPLNLTVMDGRGGASKAVGDYAPFSIYDGDYISSADGSYADAQRTPGYSMRLTGVFEGYTSGGQDVQSNEFAIGVSICRNCGVKDEQGKRVPLYATRVYTPGPGGTAAVPHDSASGSYGCLLR